MRSLIALLFFGVGCGALGWNAHETYLEWRELRQMDRGVDR